jgi:hypothetical protein
MRPITPLGPEDGVDVPNTEVTFGRSLECRTSIVIGCCVARGSGSEDKQAGTIALGSKWIGGVHYVDKKG